MKENLFDWYGYIEIFFFFGLATYIFVVISRILDHYNLTGLPNFLISAINASVISAVGLIAFCEIYHRIKKGYYNEEAKGK